MTDFFVNTVAIVEITKGNGYRSGFSLIDTLLAMLLFSMTILGLLGYQKTLLSQSYQQAELQQAWRLAHQMLEVYPETIIINDHRWRLILNQRSLNDNCIIVTAQVIGRNRVQAELERIFC